MSTSWQILNIAKGTTRLHKRELLDDEKLKSKNQGPHNKNYCCYCFLGSVLFILIILFIYASHSHLFRRHQIAINPNSSSSIETLDPSKDLLVVIMSAKWNTIRRRNSIDICKYFESNDVKCVIMDGFDGRNLTLKQKEALIRKGYIHKNFKGMHTSTKIGTAITKILAMKTAIDLNAQSGNGWKYALLFEDDALINDGFLDALQERFMELKYYLPDDEKNEKWDILQLFGAYWCNPWNINKRMLIKYLGHSLYQYVHGFALYTAILSPISSLQKFLTYCLPFEDSSDIWIGHFIETGVLNAYMTCPPIAGEIGGPSVIHPDRYFPRQQIFN